MATFLQLINGKVFKSGRLRALNKQFFRGVMFDMMKKLSLTIILVFAVLFITACAQSNNVPNTNVDSDNNVNNPTSPVDNKADCTDSDGGLNEKTYGYVTDNNGRFNDSCLNPTTVKETKCGIAGFVDYTSIECLAGYACEKGACVKTDVSTQTLCTDSDGGINEKVVGYVVDKNGRFNDTCLNPSTVKETKCGIAGFVDYTSIECLAGFACEKGACVKTDVNTQTLCSDSDGGLDEYTKGTVKDKSGKTFTDECLNNRQVKEYKCGSADYSSSTYMDCANGCLEGACVK